MLPDWVKIIEASKSARRETYPDRGDSVVG
jgi:hypothetical protein